MVDDFLRSLAERFDPAAEAGKTDPQAWLEHRLGAHGWSKQIEIMRSVQDNQRTAVPSCHGAGKSQVAAWTIARFIDTHEPGTAFVITTAPRAHQVRAILWRYLRKIHREANLPGHITDGPIPEWKIDGDMVGFGRKPADMDSETLQGLHEYRLLIVFDEACGINEGLYNAAESLMTNEGCHWLCIGNPDDRSSFFAKVCQTEPGWNVIPISAFDTPNLTGEKVPEDVAKRLVSREFVDDKAVRWGETSALYRAKVLGQWVDAEDGLIPLSWATAAVRRWHEWKDTGAEPETIPGRVVIGVDPAWLGSDQSAVVVRKGPVVLKIRRYNQLDTGQLTSIVLAEMRRWVSSVAVVDAAGVGAGVLDQLRAAEGARVIGFNGANRTDHRDKSKQWRFPNARSASWHRMRELLDPINGERICLPDDDQLIADITAPTYGPGASNTLVVERKDQVKARIGRSPDSGDALACCFWTDPPGKYLTGAEAVLAGDDDRPRPIRYRTGPGTEWEGFTPPPGYRQPSRRRRGPARTIYRQLPGGPGLPWRP